MTHMLDPIARKAFLHALWTDSCGDLLDHLFEGGGLTIDPETGGIIRIPATTIIDLARNFEP